jgi:hypothetical protein
MSYYNGTKLRLRTILVDWPMRSTRQLPPYPRKRTAGTRSTTIHADNTSEWTYRAHARSESIKATHFCRVEEIYYITDPARNIKRRPQTKVWKVEQVLGRGGFGEVRLEKNSEDEKARVVKRIPTASTNLSINECEKELKALLEFSKPKAS